MTDKYSHRERVEMILKGETPEDRAAGSVWRHFFHREWIPDEFVAAMVQFQSEYDWDFMKINPRASYHVQDWGNEVAWSHDEFKNHVKTRFAVQKYEDWEKIEPLHSTARVLQEHLQSIAKIRKEVGPDLHLFMTVFSPLSVARYLIGHEDPLMEHLRAVPEKVLPALENITLTYEKYVEDIIDAGADGIFFATTKFASADIMTWDEYIKYGLPFDLRVLNRVKNRLNILHVCASNNFLKELADYPAQLVNWDSSDPTNVPLDKATAFLKGKTVIGGIDHTGWLKRGRPEGIKTEMDKIRTRMKGERFIFGPGCAVDPDVPAPNIRAIRTNL
jgi:uroporphyrinogen decarboxylase